MSAVRISLSLLLLLQSLSTDLAFLKDCGNAIVNGGAPTPPGDCSMVCSGNSSEFCGGPDRLNLYNYTGTNLPATGTKVGAGGGGGGGASTVSPVLSGLPAGWAYNACWV
jgi:hypothetical protein